MGNSRQACGKSPCQRRGIRSAHQQQMAPTASIEAARNLRLNDIEAWTVRAVALLEDVRLFHNRGRG
jgi:hypothetical protein